MRISGNTHSRTGSRSSWPWDRSQRSRSSCVSGARRNQSRSAPRIRPRESRASRGSDPFGEDVARRFVKGMPEQSPASSPRAGLGSGNGAGGCPAVCGGGAAPPGGAAGGGGGRGGEGTRVVWGGGPPPFGGPVGARSAEEGDGIAERGKDGNALVDRRQGKKLPDMAIGHGNCHCLPVLGEGVM